MVVPLGWGGEASNSIAHVFDKRIRLATAPDPMVSESKHRSGLSGAADDEGSARSLYGAVALALDLTESIVSP